MASSWVDLTAAEVAALCADGRLIARGALNDAYAAVSQGQQIFIRHRLIDDDQYGQTFVGERYVTPLLTGAVRVPSVLQVVADESGRERFGILEFVEATTPVWDSSTTLDEMATVLAAVHGVRGRGLGDIGGPFVSTPVPNFLRKLLHREFARLPRSVVGSAAADAFDAALADLDAFADEPPCLCHGDVHANNWLQGTDGHLWPVDWEAARFRVAAADFNQMHAGWLSPAQQDRVLTTYVRVTGRDRARFERQVKVLRLLWHLRTFNFHVLVRAEPVSAHEHQLAAMTALFGAATSLVAT